MVIIAWTLTKLCLFINTNILGEWYKAAQMKSVLNAVKVNVELYHTTKGESCIVGVEDFTAAQLKMFDALLDQEIYQANK